MSEPRKESTARSRPAAAIVGTGFIAGLHLDALRRLGVRVTGILGSAPERAKHKAAALGVDRVYADAAELLADDDVDVIHITSPNHLHAGHALAALDAGRHVVCEKPLALGSEDGLRMVRAARAAGTVHAVCFNVRFYPVLHEAAERVARGAIGEPRLVSGHYLQDWLLHEHDWNWRLQESSAGPLRAVADIGSHWLDLAVFVTGRRVESVFADLHTHLPVRQRPRGQVETFAATGTAAAADPGQREPVTVTSDDSAGLLLRFEGGARGVLTVSQVSPGRKNSLAIEVDGAGAALAWDSEQAEQLWLGHRDEPNRQLWRDASLMGPSAAGLTHYPGGHAEGFAETFLGLFTRIYDDVARGGPSARPAYPTFDDGLEGLLVEDAVLRSAREGRWADVERPHR